jgi:DNA polymerase-3 subunit alpha
MVPNERGKDLTLSQCYYGDEDHTPIKSFVEEMDKNPEYWILARSIEGLVTRIGIHAAGILITEEEPSTYNSLIKTSRGVVVSAFELKDSEQMGGLKYDMLTVQALDKIHATFNYLLDDHRIKWQGGLRKTYNKYLLPANLNYDNKEMWQKLSGGDIVDIFQFDTLAGSEAIRKIQPKNIGELAVANSIMRLMAQEGMDQPTETYVKYKNNIHTWYREMSNYGLKDSEIEVLEPYLKPLYGVADSQEAVMMLVMDKNIANFDITEANSLRKAIAKKKADILADTKKMFYEKGNYSGTSSNLLNYVWNVQIGRQIGYSFSILHTMAYSTIALQEMNLATFYPDIYWKTACLSVNAGAINEEDYYNLVEEGIIELSDEDDVKKQTKIQYGKIASAISKFRKEIKIKLPDINTSRMGFTPDVKSNTIRYGIKGISRVGDHIIQEIILNRPYESLEGFLKRMLTPDGKKIISKDKVVNLIKAGAFDDLEEGTRPEILDRFMRIIADRKNNLNLNNFLMLMRNGLVPEQYSEEMKCYNFTRYIRKFRFDNSYILDEVAQDYFLERFPEDKMELKNKEGEEVKTISDSWWDRVYNIYMDTIRAWIKSNMQTLLKKLNEALYNAEHEKYASGTILDWELEALSFFYSGHPLKGVSIPYDFDRLSDVKDEEIIGFFPIKGKKIPELKLYSLVGTVIDKNKQKSMITFSTTEGVIDVRLYKKQFTKYSHADEESGDEDFLEKGTHLMITGLKRGEIFVLKTYKKTGVKSILKLEVDWDNKVASFKQKVD